jgi:hypothetical protein
MRPKTSPVVWIRPAYTRRQPPTGKVPRMQGPFPVISKRINETSTANGLDRKSSALLLYTRVHHFVPTVLIPRQFLPSDRPRHMSTVFVADLMLRAVESSDGFTLAKIAMAGQQIHSLPPPDVSAYPSPLSPLFR